MSKFWTKITENQNVSNILKNKNGNDVRESIPNCSNHHQKQATHCLQSTETYEIMYYCEKCSIMLASQGFNILKLNICGGISDKKNFEKNIMSQRQIQIREFLNEIQTQINSMSSKNFEAEQYLKISQTNYNLLIEDVTMYFKQIQDVLQIQKYLCYNMILNHRLNIQSDLRAYRESILGQIDELVNISHDISNNMEAVETVQDSIYNSIVQNYHNKLMQSYEANHIQFKLPNKYKIFLPQIPNILYSFADKITLQIQNNQKDRKSFSNQQINFQLAHNHYLNDKRIDNSQIKSKISTHQKHRSSIQSSKLSKRQMSLEQIMQQKRTNTELYNFLSLGDLEAERKATTFSFDSSELMKNIYDGLSNSGLEIHEGHIFTRNMPTFAQKINENSQNPFKIAKRQNSQLYPQQMMIRESLNLTQIQQNEEQFDGVQKRRYGYGFCYRDDDDVIPEQIITSRQSIEGYLRADTLGSDTYEKDSRAEETETLLIC